MRRPRQRAGATSARAQAHAALRESENEYEAGANSEGVPLGPHEDEIENEDVSGTRART